MTRLTRAAIIITAISSVAILVFKDVGRGVFLLLPPFLLVVVIILWGFVAMTSLACRWMDWRVRRMAARANATPSDTGAYVQDFAVSFFPTWLAVLILLVLGWAAWKVAPWGISLLP